VQSNTIKRFLRRFIVIEQVEPMLQRADSMPDREVHRLWKGVAAVLSEAGYHEALEVPMPQHLQVRTKVRAEDLKRLVQCFGASYEKGSTEEHGKVIHVDKLRGLLLPIGETSWILIARVEPHVEDAVCHEIAHFFEASLKMPPGTFAHMFDRRP